MKRRDVSVVIAFVCTLLLLAGLTGRRTEAQEPEGAPEKVQQDPSSETAEKETEMGATTVNPNTGKRCVFRPRTTIAQPVVQPSKGTPKQADRLVLYFFHSDGQCPCSEDREASVSGTLNEKFSRETKAGKLEWAKLCIEDEENRHFADEYRLLPTDHLHEGLVLVEVKNEKRGRWKKLEEDADVEKEIRAFMKEASGGKTVDSTCPGLATGGLKFAVLGELPDGVILQAGDLKISADEFKKIVSWEPKYLQFFVFEREASDRILLPIAKAELEKAGVKAPRRSSRETIRNYLDKKVEGLHVTDEEISRFYESKKDDFRGASLQKVKSSIRSHLTINRKRQAVSKIIRNLGKQVRISVSLSWVEEQAKLAKTGPVEKMRASGKPSVIAFSGATCCGPDLVQSVLDTLTKKYGEGVNVMCFEPRKELTLAERYDVQVIPTVILYDKNGCEIFRYTGDITVEKIEEKLNASKEKTE